MEEIARVGEGAGSRDAPRSLFCSGQCRMGCHQRPSVGAPPGAIIGGGASAACPRSCKQRFSCLSFWGSNCLLSSQRGEEPRGRPGADAQPPGLKPQASKSTCPFPHRPHAGSSKVSGSTSRFLSSHCPMRCKSGWECLSLGLLRVP